MLWKPRLHSLQRLDCIRDTVCDGKKPPKTSKGVLVLCPGKHPGGLVGVFYSGPLVSCIWLLSLCDVRTTLFRRLESKAVPLMQAAAVIQRTLEVQLSRKISSMVT